ncbi:preprotein translocase subunit YajC [Pseudarthrobacter sp. J1763]|uniref:preprotein translocase subunit YajC n=1 Tax=Pseudarthrobacter sp. J1763 TaxID=3420445 RepID=UPI003D28D240
MMFRRNKKAQQAQQTLQSQFAPGVDVMTSFGLYGTIVSMDEENNKVVLELSPGNLATVHRQAVTKIVEPETAAVPNDASSLTADEVVAEENTTANDATLNKGPVADAPVANETPEETLNRLNEQGNKDK